MFSKSDTKGNGAVSPYQPHGSLPCHPGGFVIPGIVINTMGSACVGFIQRSNTRPLKIQVTTTI